MNRLKEIFKISIIGIVVNLFLVIIKVIIGTISGSIAIISDATNNFSDAASSLITIMGSRLAAKDPDDKHPYGYGRIEYITGFIISVIVLVLGIEFMKTSFQSIFHPTNVKFDGFTLLIMILTVFIKLILGSYTAKSGKKISSPAVEASGAEALSDAVITSITIVAAFLTIAGSYFFDKEIHLDGFAGLIVSGFIIYSGFRLAMETFQDIIGKRAEQELSKQLYEEIEKFSLVRGAYDLILHNYGPERYLGSVNVEVEDYLQVREVAEVLNQIQQQILDKFHIFLVIGIYSVNTQDKQVVDLRNKVWEILKQKKEILNMHAFFADQNLKIVRFDLIVSFDLKDLTTLKEQVEQKLKTVFSEYEFIINIDRRYV